MKYKKDKVCRYKFVYSKDIIQSLRDSIDITGFESSLDLHLYRTEEIYKENNYESFINHNALIAPLFRIILGEK
jgi:hypothetical protein